MAQRSNNEWKENALVFNFPNVGCTALREHIPDLFRVAAKLSGAPMDKKMPCVIPAVNIERVFQQIVKRRI